MMLRDRSTRNRPAARLTVPLLGSLLVSLVVGASCGSTGIASDETAAKSSTLLDQAATTDAPATGGDAAETASPGSSDLDRSIEDVQDALGSLGRDAGDGDGSDSGGSLTGLPGEPFDGILPTGAVLGVVGVAANDVLNLRALPGVDHPVVDTLPPLATGLVFTGRERLIDDGSSVWYEVQTGEVTGWVNQRFVAPLSGTFDVTSEVLETVGEVPAAATIDGVAASVAEARSGFAEPRPTRVAVDGPTTGDLVEVTYDVLGFQDDAVRGERLHLFIWPNDGDSGLFELRTVEATYLCCRGPGGGTGLCP
jgi:hypothetical protein